MDTLRFTESREIEHFPSHVFRKGDMSAMKDRYRCSLKKLILAKLELLLLESLPNAKMRVSGSSVVHRRGRLLPTSELQ